MDGALFAGCADLTATGGPGIGVDFVVVWSDVPTGAPTEEPWGAFGTTDVTGFGVLH